MTKDEFANAMEKACKDGFYFRLVTAVDSEPHCDWHLRYDGKYVCQVLSVGDGTIYKARPDHISLEGEYFSIGAGDPACGEFFAFSSDGYGHFWALTKEELER